MTGGAGPSAYRTPCPSPRRATGPRASRPGADFDPPPSHRRTDADCVPPDWDAHDNAPPHQDQWVTVGAGAPPVRLLADGDYRAQPWDYGWDDRSGQPPDSSSIIDSADAGVAQALSAGHDEADAPYGWPTSGNDDLWDEHPAATTGPPRNQDLPAIGGPAHFPPLPQRIWTADDRPLPWYRTRRAVAAQVGAAAASIAVGIFVVTHTPSNASGDSTGVAPQATTSQPAPHPTAPTLMSSPAPPPPPPAPPPPAAGEPQIARRPPGVAQRPGTARRPLINPHGSMSPGRRSVLRPNRSPRPSPPHPDNTPEAGTGERSRTPARWPAETV